MTMRDPNARPDALRVLLAGKPRLRLFSYEPLPLVHKMWLCESAGHGHMAIGADPQDAYAKWKARVLQPSLGPWRSGNFPFAAAPMARGYADSTD